jgi:hypothetical protein
MPKTSAAIYSGAMAGHFAEAERTHDCAATCRMATNDFAVRCAPAELFQNAQQGQDTVEIGSEYLLHSRRFLFPETIEDLGRRDDEKRRHGSVRLRCIVIRWPRFLRMW